MDLALIINQLKLGGWSKLEWLCMVHEVSVDDMKDMLEVLQRKSLVEELSDGFTDIGMHDLWQEFAVLESKSQDSKDRQWVYQADGKRAMKRSGRWMEGVERMCFLNEGWRVLQGLNLADFVNVEAFKLNTRMMMRDCSLDLDLSGLNHLKSLSVTTWLTVRASGLSSLTNLGFLYFSGPRLAPCVDWIDHLRNLQFLLLKNCNVGEVVDLTQLTLLREVRIWDILDLIRLRGFSSRMASLRKLIVLDCKSLRECMGLDELHALEVLCMRKCGKLKRLPWLGRLTNLRELKIFDCKSIRAVPGLSDLVALEELDAWGCSNLATLPDLVKLTKLRELDMWRCPVQEVPGLDGLVALTSLNVSFDKLSGELPALSELSALKVVRIEGWNGPIWTSIQNLLMLEELVLRECKGEEVVPDLQSLKRLKSVKISVCNFKELSGLSHCTSLESLRVEYCVDLERLPEFERLTKLSGLTITRCKNLRDWPSASNLCSLKQLRADGFSMMKIVPHLQMLSGLRELELDGDECDDVLKKTSFSQLETLKILFFETTEALDVSNFPQLKELKLYGCDGLERVTCSTPLTALTELEVEECKNLVELPELSAFPQLEKLRLERCSAVRRLTCSSSLATLREIELVGCASGIEMPDFSRFPNLVKYSVEDEVDHEDEDMANGSRWFCCCGSVR